MSFVATTALRLLRVTVQDIVCVCARTVWCARNENHVFSAARFEVLLAALTKRQVFCDVTPDLTTQPYRPQRDSS